MSEHWFDRLAVSAAEGQGVSRRSVFKGAAAAAFAASALSSPRVARAAAHLEARAAQSDCRDCIFSTAADEVKAVHKCVSTGGKTSSFLKTKKSHPPKAPPIPSAQVINCILLRQAQAGQLFSLCRAGDCKNEGLPPLDVSDPHPGGPTTSGCAPGTRGCPGTDLCCYGNDACCPCNGDVICCAAVIGCTCC